MAKKTKQNIVIPQNRRLDFEVLFERSTKQEKVMTMGLVSDRMDSYRTVIKPDGCTTPIESVLIDYNHNFINTGAYMEDLGIQKREVPTGNSLSPTEKIDMRVVEVHVPITAKAYTKENNEKPLNEIPSLYEYVESGRVRWGSVFFAPDENETEIVTNKNGKVIREVYNKWELPAFSLLDVPPGQSTSYTFNVRSLNFKKRNKMDFNEIKELIAGLLKAKGIEFTELTGVVVSMTSEESGNVHFMLDGDQAKEYVVEYSVVEDAVTLSEELKNVTEETEHEGEEIDEMKPSESGEEMRTEGIKTSDDKLQSDVVSGEGSEIAKKAEGEGADAVGDKPTETKARYAYVGQVIKNKDGELAKVTKVISETKDGGETLSTATISRLDGQTEEIEANSIGYGAFESGENTSLWIEANLGDVLDLVTSTKEKKADVVESTEALVPPVESTEAPKQSDEEIETQRKLAEELEAKDLQIKTISGNYDKLRKSPIESRGNVTSSATDSESGSENTEAQNDEKLAREVSRLRFM